MGKCNGVGNTTYEYYGADFCRAIEYIEEGVAANKPLKKIRNDLQDEIGNRYESFRVAFGHYMPCPLITYIRRRILTTGYTKYRKERPKLARRKSYRGINAFIKRFENEFGRSVFEDLDEQELQPAYNVEELRIIHRMLSGMPFIEKYSLDIDTASVTVNDKELLKACLKLDIFLLPRPMLQQYMALDKEYRIGLLFVITPIARGIARTVSISEEDVKRILAAEKLYDLENPVPIGNYLIFAPFIPPYLKDTFIGICDELLLDIYSFFPPERAPADVGCILRAVSGSSTIKEFSGMTGINEDHAKQLIWDLLVKGCLRLAE